MPSSPIAHKLNEHSCRLATCSNSKTKGASMRRCSQCQTVHYCSTECQRADWPNHKVWCRAEVAKAKLEQSFIDKNEIGSNVAEDFDTWRTAMGPFLFIWICVHGLGIYRRPENIRNKFVHLAVRERKERPSNARKMFEFVDITVYDRAALPVFLGPELGGTAKDFEVQYRDMDLQERAKGKAGVALFFTSVAPPEGSKRSPILRSSPVILKLEALEEESFPEWKDMMKDIINNGTNIKRMLIDREKAGEL